MTTSDSWHNGHTASLPDSESSNCGWPPQTLQFTVITCRIMHHLHAPRQESVQTGEGQSFDGQRAVEVGKADHLSLSLVRAVELTLGRVKQSPLRVHFFRLLPLPGEHVSPLIS